MATNAFAAGAYAATQGLGGLGSFQKPLPGKTATGVDFGSMLQGAVNGVAQAGHKAETQAMAAAACVSAVRPACATPSTALRRREPNSDPVDEGAAAGFLTDPSPAKLCVVA